MKKTAPKKKTWIIAWVLSLILVIVIVPDRMSAQTLEKEFTASVMAPLLITDFQDFKRDLALSKAMGVDAVSVDVWWGKVEAKKDNQFEWQYYDQVFSAIKEADLKIVAIMSFHECGGNVGDTVNISLPEWVWYKYENTALLGKRLTKENLSYKSSQGHTSKEYLSLWADQAVANEYKDFMEAFEEHYGKTYQKDFLEINISCGPSGELRYPSYNSHDTHTGYPYRGALQCYSKLAITDFRNEMMKKYGTLKAVNKAWQTHLTAIAQITPPTDDDNFFTSQSYYQLQYGKDFLQWYNNSLIAHGERMITYAEDALDEELKDVKLGIKMPGVHWQLKSDTPRAAEVAAGLINSDFSADNGYGYKNIMDMAASHKDKVTLHFTCLEMNDEPPQGFPKTLTGYVGKAAKEAGITLKGENALPSGNDEIYFWNNIDEALTNAPFNGITLLRMKDIVEGNSRNYCNTLICKHKDNSLQEHQQVQVKFILNTDV